MIIIFIIAVLNILYLIHLKFSFLPISKCVDEWLRVNATCPTCRKSILPSTQNSSNSDHSINNNMINITSGDRAGQRLITLNFDLTGGAGNSTNG